MASSLNVSSSLSTLAEPKIQLPRGNGLSLTRCAKLQTSNGSRVMMSASKVEKKGMVTVPAAATVAMLTAAAMIIPDIAEAASPGVSPSLKNLLLSVVAGGVVLIAIGSAVAGVSTFDPVQRK